MTHDLAACEGLVGPRGRSLGVARAIRGTPVAGTATMRPEHPASLRTWIRSADGRTRHAMLIDPADQEPVVAAARAVAAVSAGTRMVLVGGSTGTSGDLVHATVEAVQEALELRLWAASQDASAEDDDWAVPVVLFPGTGEALSLAADGVLFMMLMNSRDRRFLIEEQRRGAPVLVRSDVEPIPTGYVVVEPGGAVGEVGAADLVPADDSDMAASYAAAAAGFGFDVLYLEAGSGADTPVPPGLIEAARGVHGGALMVGGGLRDEASVRAASVAGADWVVTGTWLEGLSGPEAVADQVRAIHRALR